MSTHVRVTRSQVIALQEVAWGLEAKFNQVFSLSPAAWAHQEVPWVSELSHGSRVVYASVLRRMGVPMRTGRVIFQSTWPQYIHLLGEGVDIYDELPPREDLQAWVEHGDAPEPDTYELDTEDED